MQRFKIEREQVSFHGFPGTMGADFIHYLVADARTATPDHQV
jgi:predicted O-linked N-acetylglucosamine transferase (SPINDLY family)